MLAVFIEGLSVKCSSGYKHQCVLYQASTVLSIITTTTTTDYFIPLYWGAALPHTHT